MSPTQQPPTATPRDRSSRMGDGSTTSKILDFGAANPIVIFHVMVLLTGLAIMCFTRVEHLAVALLWALACLASGGMVGFLFGIPRALQQQPTIHQVPGPTPNRTDGGTAQDHSGSAVLGVNTNLEQISDWLTKIIVGIGLVELRNFPGYLKSIADYIAAGVGSQPDSKTLVIASLIYFSVMGFIDAYLITRTYLSKVIKAFDDDTISASDIEVPVAGMSLSLAEVSRQVRANLNDLRDQIVRLHPGLHLQGPMASAAARFPAKSILWVDDEPDDNGLAVEELNRLNIKIDAARTTDDALKRLAQKPYDLVISDVVRIEGGTTNPKAGIDLLEAVRKSNPTLPFVIMSDPVNVTKYKGLEESMPDVVVTSSSTELIAALHHFFQEPGPQPATAAGTETNPPGQAAPQPNP